MATAHHDEHPTGMLRWLTTTNHKDIGTLYLVFALIMFFVGGAMALVMPIGRPTTRPALDSNTPSCSRSVRYAST